jgi:hypothetical protein
VDVVLERPVFEVRVGLGVDVEGRRRTLSRGSVGAVNDFPLRTPDDTLEPLLVAIPQRPVGVAKEVNVPSFWSYQTSAHALLLVGTSLEVSIGTTASMPSLAIAANNA